MKKFILLLVLTLSTQLAFGQGSGRTTFDPQTDGFNFENSFKNIVISEIDFVTGGLCGGMVYSALDYYYSSVPVPTQSHRPADNSELRNYIYERQNISTLENADKWTELFVNPFGWRTSEYFNWGLQGFGGGRLQELKASIDKGYPAPLGLFAGGDGGGGAHHQVLAIGYECGRYTGDLGAHKEDLKIFIYDPNFPNQTMTLRPSVATNDYYYEENDKKRWMTYFVDGKYNKSTPPTIETPSQYPNDGKVHELVLAFQTGNDDLRGGNDNVDVVIHLQNGEQVFANANRSHRWVGYVLQYVPIKLNQPAFKSDIKSITLKTNFGGGTFGDNWNLFSFWVTAKGNGIDEVLFSASGTEVDNKEITPLVRFTGSKKTWNTGIFPTFTMQMNTQINMTLSAPKPAAKPKPKPNLETKPKPNVTNKDLMVKPAPKPKPVPVQEDVIKELVITIKTGSDDLRGGSRANIYILKKDGKNMYFSLNNGKGWGGNSVNTITKTPLGSTKPSDITGIRIIFKSGSGISGDNWNLQEFDLSYTTYQGQKRSILNKKGNPLFRFTGDNTKMELPIILKD